MVSLQKVVEIEIRRGQKLVVVDVFPRKIVLQFAVLFLLS